MGQVKSLGGSVAGRAGARPVRGQCVSIFHETLAGKPPVPPARNLKTREASTDSSTTKLEVDKKCHAMDLWQEG